MSLIKSITIKNFKAIREELKIELAQGMYIVGANNSGKTTILQAVEFFFKKDFPQNESFLNKSEYLAKKEGYNKCEITIEFNIEKMTAKGIKKRLSAHGNIYRVKKIITFRERTQTCLVEFNINENWEGLEENLDQDIRYLIESIHITYLHPQDGIELLKRAQDKLRNRLILNWGRRGGVTTSLEKLKADWQSLRTTSDTYLSRSLTTKLQQIWPGCEVKVNLPKRIEDIIKVADIGIKGSKGMPEISLTSQGTGAQSMILYLAHFLLDSDRSLHRGEYHPLWLLEEPESFLHADLIFQIGKQLASKEWLDNIQVVISTHSPIVLACSRQIEERIGWATMSGHKMTTCKSLKEYTKKDIANIGIELGDSNFEAYFEYAQNRNYFLFLEDSKDSTGIALMRSGFEITKRLNGTGEISKYIDAYQPIQPSLKKGVFFLIDNDLGKKDFKRYLKDEYLVEKMEGIGKYKIFEDMYLLLLPEECALESLFSEFDNFIEEKVDLLFKKNNKNEYAFQKNIPASLTRTHAAIRDKALPANMANAKNLIKNTKDIKDLFWEKVDSEKLNIEHKYVEALKKLIEG